jgi:Tfp pilus assembly major pilin PilA
MEPTQNNETAQVAATEVKTINTGIDLPKKKPINLFQILLAAIAVATISVGSNVLYERYIKKTYVVDYSAILNQVRNEAQKAIAKGDEFTASLRVKQIEQIAVETDAFCRKYAEDHKTNVYAANLVFGPKRNMVDLTPELIAHLQSIKLIENNATNSATK